MGQEDREEKIRERAYAIWEGEGHPEGRALQHWEQASREIEAEPPQPAMQPAQNGRAAGDSNAPTIPQRAAERASRKDVARSTPRKTVPTIE
jgi:hypothetical protein